MIGYDPTLVDENSFRNAKDKIIRHLYNNQINPLPHRDAF